MNTSKLISEYVELLEKENENLRKQLVYWRDKSIGDKIGVVYIIQRDGTDEYKIGHSTNYPMRKSVFNVKLPFEVSEFAIYRTIKYKECEKTLHEMFYKTRLNGSEFFKLSKKDLLSIPRALSEVDPLTIKVTDSVNDKKMNIKGNDDALKQKALDVFEKEGRISSSLLQRRLRIGYARAARIKDDLVKSGLIQE